MLYVLMCIWKCYLLVCERDGWGIYHAEHSAINAFSLKQNYSFATSNTGYLSGNYSTNLIGTSLIMQIVNHVCLKTLNRLQGGEILDDNVMAAAERNQRKLVSIFSPFHHPERHFTYIFTYYTYTCKLSMQTIFVFIKL